LVSVPFPAPAAAVSGAGELALLAQVKWQSRPPRHAAREAVP
jgi:hypothetical protein